MLELLVLPPVDVEVWLEGGSGTFAFWVFFRSLLVLSLLLLLFLQFAL